jgi:hypothetical protein
LEGDAIQFEQGNGPYGDQQQRQGPGREVYDNDVDCRDQRSCRIEAPKIELSGACWWGGHGYRAVGGRFGGGWMSHNRLRRHSAQHSAKTAFPSLIFDQREQEFPSPKIWPQGRCEAQFCVGQLPQEKIADPGFSTRPNQ